jgi:hypothetical protein
VTARSPLIVLAPLVDGAAGAVRAAVAALPQGDDSPFARVPGLHLARIVVVDHLGGRPGDPPAVTTPHLLLTTDFDGPLDAHLRALRAAMGRELDEVLGWCAGYRPDRFERWIEAFRQRAGFSVIGYPGATVPEVRHWLGVRRRLARVAVNGHDPEALRAAWDAEFGG